MRPPGGAEPVEMALFPHNKKHTKMKVSCSCTPSNTHPLLFEAAVLLLSGSSPCGDNVMSVGSQSGTFSPQQLSLTGGTNTLSGIIIGYSVSALCSSISSFNMEKKLV